VTPQRGEVWIVDLDPVAGHEQAGRRPALVVSSDDFNAIRIGLVIVVPVTTAKRGVRLHVAIEPPDGGLRKLSFAMAEQVRCVSIKRFRGHVGRVSKSKLDEVDTALREVLGLNA
jgi:mRNA interferase MazF